jgi:hypothetical protein
MKPDETHKKPDDCANHITRWSIAMTTCYNNAAIAASCDKNMKV